MSKDPKERVKETLDVVRHYFGVPMNQRTVAADHAKQWIKTNYTSTATFEQFAKGLSQKNNAVAGDAATRQRRRACVLLSTVLQRPAVETAGYHTLAPGSLDRKLRALIEAAYWAGDTSGTACLDVLLNDLLRDPVGWLNTHALSISTSDASGKVACHFYYDSGQDRFCIRRQSSVIERHGCHFEALQVPAVAWHQWTTAGAKDHSQMTGVVLDDRAEIMVTTQMTGCSLVYKRANDGRLYAAHAYPDKRNRNASLRQDGDHLAEQLLGQHGATAADFVNAAGGTVHVYGPTGDGVDGYDVATNTLYIIGIRRASGWKIYGQHVAALDGSLRVYRLYPTPVVRKY